MENQAYIDMKNNQDKHWWFSARRLILSMFIKQMKLPANADILEIGSGPGGNLSMLEQFGNVTAIEMDAFCRKLIEEDYQSIPVYDGSLPDKMPFKDKTFDLICMFDVLEHIEDDVAALQALHAYLKPEGRLFITIPAYQFLFNAHDKHLHHFRRYRCSQAVKKFKACGWNPLRKGYFNTLLFPIALPIRMYEKVTNKQETVGNETPGALVNTVFKVIFAAERYMLKFFGFPFGLSIFAILKTKTTQK